MNAGGYIFLLLMFLFSVGFISWAFGKPLVHLPLFIWAMIIQYAIIVIIVVGLLYVVSRIFK